MAGGVQNLRALFEQNSNNSNPHNRILEDSADGGETSQKPLSKVRTSFVAVERSGVLGNKLGSRRDVSGESSTSQTSCNTQGNTKAKDFATRTRTTCETTMKASSNQTAKKQELSESDPKRKTTVKAKLDTTQSTIPSGNTSKVKPMAAKQISKPPPVLSSNRANHFQKNLSSTSPISTAKNTESRRVEMKTSRGSTSSTHPSGPSNSKSLLSSPRAVAKTQTVPPQSRFQKPHPKSPTRPVKLPASLTTHTASSSSKFAAVSPITKTQCLLPGKSLISNRPASQMSLASRAHPGKKDEINRNSPSRRISAELKRKLSTQSLTSQAAPVEDKFLARMMRPTTSSTFKAAEKSTSPSRQSRSTSRPRTRNGLPDPPSKLETKKSPLGARKVKKEVNTAHNESKLRPSKLQNREAIKAPKAPNFQISQEASEPMAAKDVENTEVNLEVDGPATSKLETEPVTLKDEVNSRIKNSEPDFIANGSTMEPTSLEAIVTDPKIELYEDNNTSIEVDLLQNTLDEKEVAKKDALETDKLNSEMNTQTDSSAKKLTIETSSKETKILIQSPDKTSEDSEDKKVESTQEEAQIQLDQAEELKSSLSNIEIKEVFPKEEKTDSLYSSETSPLGLVTSEHTENRSSSVASPVSPIFEGFTGPQPKTSLLIPSPSHFDTCRSPITMNSAVFEDPEDIRAREEIALLNAELMKTTFSAK